VQWVAINPEVLLVVFIPVLIFDTAFNTDVHIFQREIWQVSTYFRLLRHNYIAFYRENQL
jgi:NhaP-type Na+/H+ or K+/H+ antiporter